MAKSKRKPPTRVKLDDDRTAVTHAFQIGAERGYLTVGEYPDGSPGEIFLRMDKEGSTLSGFADSFAIAMSIALQYGVPLSAFTNKFKNIRFEPEGPTARPDVRPLATSVVDYVAHWLEKRYQSENP
jgi:ribonucleoside-diphosphate reductase alpha chain